MEIKEGLERIESKLQRGMKTRIKMKANIELSRVADMLFLLPRLSIISHLFEPSLPCPSPPSQTDLLIESKRVYAEF